MAASYNITYHTENQYESPVIEACWQFLIVPQENESQSKPTVVFSTSEQARWEFSHNGFGFSTIRVRNRHNIQNISFTATFTLIKAHINPFDFDSKLLRPIRPTQLAQLEFRMRFDQYLQNTRLTTPPTTSRLFEMDWSRSILDNLLHLNHWIYQEIEYSSGITHVDTLLNEVLALRKGVCQDFAHLFIGIARRHGIPARYVSGYLHQGQGFFGDAQMHAWTEAYVPDLGWIGFDPTNNILAASDHIKVAHGRDYEDCAPLKGVVYGRGSNTSLQRVQVIGTEQ